MGKLPCSLGLFSELVGIRGDKWYKGPGRGDHLWCGHSAQLFLRRGARIRPWCQPPERGSAAARVSDSSNHPQLKDEKRPSTVAWGPRRGYPLSKAQDFSIACDYRRHAALGLLKPSLVGGPACRGIPGVAGVDAMRLLVLRNISHRRVRTLPLRSAPFWNGRPERISVH